ncbi:serine/threonine-protein kinase, partial [Streptomyces sp. ActVer]|uniref:serine/threonine-protein kinase n=1 Tax=Streptomyces sp. ActVer TaxID=3014558 RepID=UPI0022B2CAC0
ARARAEARHAAGLRGHPHVVTVHDVLEHEGLPWIVMEYVPGALDLHALVTQRGPLAPAECARVGLAVLDALTAGHERGVMHRDVKPANILLAPDRAGSPYARVLLTDYGISVQPDGGETRYTQTSVLVGTAGYLAPERAQGGPPTTAADLFSLGCTLYYAVEGYGPFDRDSGLAALTAVVLEEPRPTLRAGALESLLAAMLTKNPVHRITAEEAEGALSAILTPQSHPRTRFDPGSEPPWAGGPTRTAAPRVPEPPGPSQSHANGSQWYAPSAA